MSGSWKMKLKEQKKWKLLHATDFGSLMQPCIFIANILGVLPFKCVSSRYAYSRILVVYSMIIMIIFTILLFILEYQINFGKSVFSSIPKMLHVQFYLIASGTIVLITYTQSGARLHLLRHLSELSSTLSSKEYNKMAKFIHSKDVIVSLFLFTHIFNCVKGDLHRTLRNFTTLYMTLISYIMTMFYVNCVCVLKACFIKINEDLEQFKKPVNQKFLRHGQGTVQLLMKLKNLEGKHIQIIDVLQLLNRTFLVQLVILTVTTFTTVTFNLYFYILLRAGGESTGTIYMHFWYLPHILPAIYHFLMFSMIIWACETTTNKAERIRTTLYDGLSEATDLVVKREVELFSLQLLHHETSFCVKTIKLNAALLMEMVESINMHLLILIQFLLNSVMCALKNQ